MRDSIPFQTKMRTASQRNHVPLQTESRPASSGITGPLRPEYAAREEPSLALTETQVKLPHPYVIPAKERAEVDASMDYSCGNTDEAGKITQRPEQECFNDAFVRISGFVGFDYSTHTRLDLPKPTFSPGMAAAAKALAK